MYNTVWFKAITTIIVYVYIHIYITVWFKDKTTIVVDIYTVWFISSLRKVENFNNRVHRAQTTGIFRKVYRSLQVRVPLNILKYLSIQKVAAKVISSVYQSIVLTQKNIPIIFDFSTNINKCKYMLESIF